MKKISIYIILFTILVACHQAKKEEPLNAVVAITDSANLMSCKIFSSEFAILDPNDKGRLIQEYKFNKRGFVNELIRYGIDGSIIGQYDIYGQENPFPTPGKPTYVDTVLTVMNLSAEGNISKKEVKKYNNKGLLVESSLFDEEGDVIQKNTYEYSSKNRIIKDVYWDVDLDQPMQVVRYEYDFYPLKK